MVVYDDLSPIEKVKIYDRGIDIEESREPINWQTFRYRSGDFYSPKVETREPLRGAVEHFIDCVIHHKTPMSDAVSGLKTIKILTAAQRSLENNGKEVSLENLWPAN
jgi:predicted dehydrogenase